MFTTPINLWSIPKQWKDYMYKTQEQLSDIDVGRPANSDHAKAMQQAGNKDDSLKLDWTLLPVQPVKAVLEVLAFGAKKYGRNNWQRIEQSQQRYLAAAMRHLTAVIDGEWLDDESGKPHLAHAGCCILFLLWFGKESK
jgi:phage gp36-like protein